MDKKQYGNEIFGSEIFRWSQGSVADDNKD